MVQRKEISADELTMMGTMYYNGRLHKLNLLGFVRINYAKALYLYHKANKKGGADSLINLRTIYENGLGLSKKDYVAAAKYYTNAADRGTPKCKAHLNALYQKIDNPLVAKNDKKDILKANTMIDFYKLKEQNLSAFNKCISKIVNPGSAEKII